MREIEVIGKIRMIEIIEKIKIIHKYLGRDIYRVSETGKLTKDFDAKSQIRRAAIFSIFTISTIIKTTRK